MSPSSALVLSRRSLLAASIALAATPKRVYGTDSVFEGLPVLAMNQGRWDGSYRFMRPDGSLVDQYDFRIRVSLSRDNALAYRQDSHYRWPDGRLLNVSFEAAYADGRLQWDNGRIHGSLWEISSQTIYLHFGFSEQPGVECHEMIQVFNEGQQRGRTWLWYRDGVLDRYTLIDERRVADDAPLEWPG